eukprot:2926341-Alexandrium_andersonii.AAC.1
MVLRSNSGRREAVPQVALSECSHPWLLQRLFGDGSEGDLGEHPRRGGSPVPTRRDCQAARPPRRLDPNSTDSTNMLIYMWRHGLSRVWQVHLQTKRI